MLLSGCANVGQEINGACAWVKPIYISKLDVLTDGTVRQILAHNETWARECE